MQLDMAAARNRPLTRAWLPSQPPPARQPTPLGALLDETRTIAARRAGQGVDPLLWREAVGVRIAERARPGRVEGRTLEVQVESSVWAQELSLLSRTLCERLRERGIAVSQLRFRVKPLTTERREPARRPPPPATARAPLPAALEAHLARVEDLELREAISEAASRWLTLDRAPRAPAAPKSPKRRR